MQARISLELRLTPHFAQAESAPDAFCLRRAQLQAGVDVPALQGLGFWLLAGISSNKESGNCHSKASRPSKSANTQHENTALTATPPPRLHLPPALRRSGCTCRAGIPGAAGSPPRQPRLPLPDRKVRPLARAQGSRSCALALQAVHFPWRAWGCDLCASACARAELPTIPTTPCRHSTVNRKAFDQTSLQDHKCPLQTLSQEPFRLTLEETAQVWQRPQNRSLLQAPAQAGPPGPRRCCQTTATVRTGCSAATSGAQPLVLAKQHSIILEHAVLWLACYTSRLLKA